MNILKLAAQLTLDGRGFRAGMKEAQSSANSFGKSLATSVTGAFGTAALVAFVHGVASAATHTKDLSEQFNATTDEVQQLGKIAREVGGMKFEDFGSALLRLGAARKDAAESNDRLLQTFNKYGISLKQLEDPTLRNIDLLKQLSGVADSLTETDRQDFADLLGLKGQGGTRLIEAMKELQKQGPIELIKREDIDAIDRAGEALEELKRKASAKASGIVGTSAQFIANLISDPRPLKMRLNEEEKAMRDKFKKTGDTIGSGLIDDLLGARAFGSEKEQADQLDLLKRHAGGNKKESRDGLIYGPPQEKLNDISPETSSKLLAEREKLEKQLAEAAVKYRLSEAKTEYQKRSILETELQKHAAAAAAQRAILGEDGISAKARLEAENNALTEDLQVAGLLSQISAMPKSSALDVSSLTQSGQIVTGRNSIVSQAESATVQEIRKLLGFNKTTAESTREMLVEYKKNPPFKVSR